MAEITGAPITTKWEGNPCDTQEISSKYIDPKTVKIVDLVKDNKKVRFSHYRDFEFWYKTDDGFSFPVPLRDINNDKVTLLAEDKALLFMRWIRKYIESMKE